MKMGAKFYFKTWVIIEQQILIEGVVACDLYARIARPSRARARAAPDETRFDGTSRSPLAALAGRIA